MVNQNLVEELRKTGDWLEAECFPPRAADLVREAADVIEQLQEGRSCMTLNVTLNKDQMKKALEQAFIEVIGKDLEYIAQAVYEKMERDGELVGETEAEESTEDS